MWICTHFESLVQFQWWRVESGICVLKSKVPTYHEYKQLYIWCEILIYNLKSYTLAWILLLLGVSKHNSPETGKCLSQNKETNQENDDVFPMYFTWLDGH